MKCVSTVIRAKFLDLQQPNEAQETFKSDNFSE